MPKTYRLGNIIFKKEPWGTFRATNYYVNLNFMQEELISMGAIEVNVVEDTSEEKLEENEISLRQSLTSNGIGLGEVSLELLANELSKMNKAINHALHALQEKS